MGQRRETRISDRHDSYRDSYRRTYLEGIRSAYEADLARNPEYHGLPRAMRAQMSEARRRAGERDRTLADVAYQLARHRFEGSGPLYTDALIVDALFIDRGVRAEHLAEIHKTPEFRAVLTRLQATPWGEGMPLRWPRLHVEAGPPAGKTAKAPVAGAARVLADRANRLVAAALGLAAALVSI